MISKTVNILMACITYLFIGYAIHRHTEPSLVKKGFRKYTTRDWVIFWLDLLLWLPSALFVGLVLLFSKKK